MEGRIEPDAASEVVFWNPFDSGKIDEFDTDPSSAAPSWNPPSSSSPAPGDRLSRTLWVSPEGSRRPDAAPALRGPSRCARPCKTRNEQAR